RRAAVSANKGGRCSVTERDEPRSKAVRGHRSAASLPVSWIDIRDVIPALTGWLSQLLNYGSLLVADMPRIKKTRHITRKRKKRNLAIPAAATAMPVKPKSAATKAITKKITAQRNIFFVPPKTE